MDRAAGGEEGASGRVPCYGAATSDDVWEVAEGADTAATGLVEVSGLETISVKAEDAIDSGARGL